MAEQTQKRADQGGGSQPRQRSARGQQRRSQRSVFQYIAILFAAAFVLLLFTYVMERRQNQLILDQNQAHITDLEQNTNSASQRLENILKERDSYKEEVQELDEEKAQLSRSLDKAQDALTAQQEQTAALNQLNLLRKLYNQHRYAEARQYLDEWEAASPGGMEQALAAVSQGLSPEEREIYDPLEAYHDLVSWLD